MASIKKAAPFSEGLARTLVDGKVTFIDKMGQVAFVTKYKEVSSFHDGVAQVKVRVSKFSPLGFIGNTILNSMAMSSITDHYDYVKHPGKYDVSMFDTVADNEKRGFINTKGDLVITTKYDFVGPYNGGGDGLTLVMKDEKSGYVNKNGEVIIPIEYDELSSFNEGIAVAKTGDKVQFIDLQGPSVTKSVYNDARPFSNGIAAYKIGEKWGYVSKEGLPIVRPKFDEANFFTEKVAAAKFNGKWRLISREGDTVAELPGITDIGSYTRGLAVVKKGEQWGIIDEAGNFVIEPKYKELQAVIISI